MLTFGVLKALGKKKKNEMKEKKPEPVIVREHFYVNYSFNLRILSEWTWNIRAHSLPFM